VTVPLPFIVLAVGEVLLWGLGGALVGVAGGRLAALAWETLFGEIAHSSVAVIGERRAGKSTLATFLSTGEIPEDYKQTLSEKCLEGRTIQLTELELNISEINDVPGDKEYYRQWEAAVVKSDVVFYLARADKMLKHKATRKRVSTDVRHLSDWLKESPGKRLFFIGTHCDLIPKFRELTPENQGDFHDKFFKNPELREVALRLREADAGLILGSLKPERAMQQVVHQAFQKIISASE
jgi:GTPase SAR1 family protein